MERREQEQLEAELRATISSATFEQAWKNGQWLVLEDFEGLIALAVENKPADLPSTRSAPGPLDSLTPREREVLAPVAQGLTDDQVAEELVLSPRTVNAHLTSIYSKLDVS